MLAVLFIPLPSKDPPHLHILAVLFSELFKVWVTNSTHIKNSCGVQSSGFHVYQHIKPGFLYGSFGHQVNEVLCVCLSSDKIIVLTVV